MIQSCECGTRIAAMAPPALTGADAHQTVRLSASRRRILNLGLLDGDGSVHPSLWLTETTTMAQLNKIEGLLPYFEV